jgi:hypothetical protein
VFCDEPESSKRIFISDHYGLWLICNRCIAKAAALIARKRKTVRRKTAQLIEIEMRQQRHHHHHADQRVGGRQDRGQRGSRNQISGIDSGMYMPKVAMLID